MQNTKENPMKITIELNTDTPEDMATAEAFSRYLASSLSTASADAPAVTLKPETKAEPKEKAKEKVESEPEEAEEAEEPRVYGATAEGRKKRTKEEMAIDKEIDILAERLSIKAVPTDAPAEEVLADLQARYAKEDKKIDDFDIEEAEEEEASEEDDDEPMSIEDFRAAVIKAVSKHDDAAKSVLKRYGKGLSAIADKDRRRVMAELSALG